MAVLNVVIYLPDNSGCQISMPDGKNATTDKYFLAMSEALCIPEPLARKYFSLWLKSPLLDLQLKLQHVPFRMVKQWGTLIQKFSMASDEEKAKDEPALFYKRNAFLFKEDELKNDNEDVFEILLMQAKNSIQHSIYPCDREDVEQLCILSCIMKKTGLQEPENIKKAIHEALPQHMQKGRRFLSRQQSVEERIFNSYKTTVKNEKVENAAQEFMKICWQLPYYGSTIFDGFVSRSQNSWMSLLQHQSSIPVKVAINTEGVWVIDQEKKIVLLGVNHNEFNWETAPAPSDGTGNSSQDEMPSLFIEFGKEKDEKLLQITSKQANMMSSMIDTCTMLLRERELHDKSPKKSPDEVNKPLPPFIQSSRVRPLFDRQDSVTRSHTDRLALASFGKSDTNGKDESHETDASHDSHNRHAPLKKQSSFRFFRHFTNKTKHEPALKEETNELI